MLMDYTTFDYVYLFLGSFLIIFGLYYGIFTKRKGENSCSSKTESICVRALAVSVCVIPGLVFVLTPFIYNYFYI